MTVAVERTAIWIRFVQSNGVFNTDIGIEAGIHVVLALGSLHLVAECRPVLSRVDGEEVVCDVGDGVRLGNHRAVIRHPVAVAQFLYQLVRWARANLIGIGPVMIGPVVRAVIAITPCANSVGIVHAQMFDVGISTLF